MDAEVATHVLDRETVSKPAEPIPMPELSTNEQVGHPTTINVGLREVPSQNLLEEENTKEEDEFKLIRDVNVEEGRTEQDTGGDLSSNEVASTNTPAIRSTSPMHGKGSKETFSEDPDLIPVGTAERSMLLLPLTPPRPVISQEDTAALAESSREAPALPEAPRLRPLASPGLPLVSPIMGRRSRASSTVGESQDHLTNIEVDKEDEESGIQQFSESFMEASSQDEDSPGLDINSQGSQGLGERPPVDPTQTLSIQQLESGAHTFPIIGADRPDSPHQMVQEDGNISMETWAFVRQSRETSVGYSRESQQDTPSDSESSGHSALDSEVNSQVEWSMANYDRYGVEAAYSDEDDEAQTEEDQELLETVSTTEEESWDEEDRDSDLESQVRADATIALDETQQDSETARTGAAVIVDLEDDSEDVLQQPQSAVKASTTMIVDLESDSQYPSQVEGSSPCAHAPDEIVSDSAAPKSPRFLSLRPEFESSVPKVMGDSEIHEHIAYPKLPEYATEQSHPSHSPLAPDTENELEDHLDPHLRTQLITPNATQQTAPASDHAIEPVQQYHDLPTPQPTQNFATGLPPMEAASSSEHRDSLSQEPKETRTLTTRKITDQTGDAPDGISRWFVPRRPSLVQSESADDDDSSEGTEESEESLESSELGVEDPLHQVERPPGHNSSYIPPSEFSESSITHPLPHEPRPIPPPVGLRTPLSYFAPLAMIPNHFGSTIDVLAITTSTTPAQRSKTGPKDYYTTFHITDPSSESSITPVQIFRPFKEALPLAEKGAAILLRNFKVQSQKHKFILVSTASSAWAVFGKGQTVQVNGPAVEIGAEERGFAKGLREWWMTVGEDFERAREELRSGEGLLEKDIEDHAVNGNGVMGLIRNGNGGLQEPDF